MLLRITLVFAATVLSATAGFSETINLRNSCQPWEAIPANEALKSPIAALLQCNDDTHSWMAMQIVCNEETAEINYRYKTSYPINTPIAPLSAVESQTETQTTSTSTPLGRKEMLFFDFPKLGVTSVVNYDFDAKDWAYTEKEPLAPLFRSLISGNYADVSLLATGQTERLPLRGSTKAIGPVVETCRIAKRKIDRKAEQSANQTSN